MEMFVLSLPYFTRQQLTDWGMHFETDEFQLDSMALSSSNIQFNHIYFKNHYVPQIMFDFRHKRLFIFLEKYDKKIIEELLTKLTLHMNNSLLFLSKTKKSNH